MAGGGGKGGSQTTQTKLPAWVEDAAKKNFARADVIAQTGYTPYYGPEVAGLTADQTASFGNTNAAAGAFGLQQGGNSLPAPTDYGNGVQGYGSGGLYDQIMAEFAQARPGQAGAINGMFIDPVTGKPPAAPFGPGQAASQPMPIPGMGGGPGQVMHENPGNASLGGAHEWQHGGAGGYTGLGDMMNGGGPGQAGTTFSGGPLSGVLNGIGVGTRQGSSMGGGK